MLNPPVSFSDSVNQIQNGEVTGSLNKAIYVECDHTASSMRRLQYSLSFSMRLDSAVSELGRGKPYYIAQVHARTSAVAADAIFMTLGVCMSRCI